MNSRKSIFQIVLLLLLSLNGKTQSSDMDGYDGEVLENMAEKNNAEPEDDSYQLDLQQFRRHPVNLNSASEEELMQLHILSPLQSSLFISYRKSLGALLNIYELQAVPGWDLETIRKILPYVLVKQSESLYISLKERWKKGDSDFLIRVSRVLEKSRGFENKGKPDGAFYEGSPEKIFIRYAYHYKQLLSYGFSGEKDAGEPFFRGAQRWGFDFYSFHFFLQRAGLIRSLAIGDFAVNLGQGLIQWQSFAIFKGSQTLNIKHESPCLRPYHAEGEFNFHRGLGISLQKGKWQSTFFISHKKISTSPGTDTTGQETLFTSFQNSGYHRTESEIADRNNNSQFSIGGSLRYETAKFSVGLNLIHFQFGQSLQKKSTTYNLFSLKGNKLSDFSVDYTYTVSNLHLFGEFAIDQWLHHAWIQGALVSLGESLDLGFVYRNISPAYQSLYSGSFTENSTPVNEQGLYSGLSFKPIPAVRCDLYYDLFVFPWLKYRVDGPSHGQDFLFHILVRPDKFWQLTVTYKQQMKPLNGTVLASREQALMNPLTKKIRIETGLSISHSVQFYSRAEWVNIILAGSRPQNGFLGGADISFNRSGFTVNLGAALFETDDYDTRIYAYETDLLYNFSIPFFYGRGLHYSLNLKRDLLRLRQRPGNHFQVSAGLKWDQTFYPGTLSVGSGLDEIPGSRKTEIKAQVLFQWQ